MEGVSDPLLDGETSLALPAGPYPGLRPYEKHEWSIFFGRETMTQDVIARLVERRLVAIHGASGCGKSSLVRAGVLPVLEIDQARVGGSWKTVVMRPEDSPIANLAEALAFGDANRADELKKIITLAENAAKPLAERLGCSTENNVCILLDQFEELFEHARKNGGAEAEIITALLTGLLRDKPAGLHAIITMRSDYLGHCAHYRGFAETVNETQYLVPRMERPALWRAMREPARLYGGTVDPTLVERLIADAGTGQDQLPLMQHGLMLMWRRKTGGDAAAQGWKLDRQDYGNEGSLGQLLSRHADDVLAAAAGNTGDLRIAELAFRALTDYNTDKQAIRRPRRFSELCAATGASPDHLQRILLPFREADASFLRPYGEMPLTAASRVDISHEAFIRNWDKIANPDTGWLGREADDGLRWTTLRLAAEGHEADNASLLSPAAAEEAHRIFSLLNPAWAERHGGQWDGVQRLIEASRGAARRATNRSRLLVGAAVAVAFTMAGLAWYAMEQTRHAQEQAARAEAAAANAEEKAAEAEAARAVTELAVKAAEDAQRRAEEAQLLAENYARQAERDRQRALHNESISLGALARIAMDEGDQTTALKLGLAAWPRLNDPTRPMLKDVLDVAGRAVAAMTDLETLSVAGKTAAVAVSPDGRIVAVGTVAGEVLQWDLQEGIWLPPLEGSSEIVSLAFSSDGSQIAAVSVDGSLQTWDVQQPQADSRYRFDGEHISPQSVVRMDYAATGGRLAVFIGSNDRVFVFDVNSWKPHTIDYETLVVGDISPDGSKLFFVDTVSGVSVRDATTGAQFVYSNRVAESGNYVAYPTSAEYSRDGKKVVVASQDRYARILDSASLQPLLEIPLGASPNSAIISPDGSRLLTCGEGILIWDLASGRRIASHADIAGQWCRHADWASDGKSVVATYDSPVVWDVSSIGSSEAMALGCERLGDNTGLLEIELRYGLTALSPICGDNQPLPVEPAHLQ
jgi:hypothetical protein